VRKERRSVSENVGEVAALKPVKDSQTRKDQSKAELVF
jgi:hypothetical protein